PAQGAVALARRQPPCQGAATPATGAAAPVGGRPLRAGHWRPPLVSCRLWATASMGDSPYGLALAASSRPLVGGLGHSRLPLQSAWPWVAAPTTGLVMAGHPCKGSGRGQPPLQVAWPAAPSSLRLLQKCNKNA
ncbi:hypothetical protein BHE74_00057409, partial [Ensete ventricosum]